MLEDIQKMPVDERSRRLAEFMEPRPTHDIKTIDAWNRDDRTRIPAMASHFDFPSPKYWWRIVIDFGSRRDHVPQWRPSIDLALDGEFDMERAFEVIEKLKTIGWLTDIRSCFDGFVINARSYIMPQGVIANGFEQIPCDSVPEGVALLALVIAEKQTCTEQATGT